MKLFLDLAHLVGCTQTDRTQIVLGLSLSKLFSTLKLELSLHCRSITDFEVHTVQISKVSFSIV